MAQFVNVVNSKLPGQMGRIPKAALPGYEEKGWKIAKDADEGPRGTSKFQDAANAAHRKKGSS